MRGDELACVLAQCSPSLMDETAGSETPDTTGRAIETVSELRVRAVGRPPMGPPSAFGSGTDMYTCMYVVNEWVPPEGNTTTTQSFDR